MQGPETWLQLFSQWGPYWSLVAGMGWMIWFLVKKLIEVNDRFTRVAVLSAEATKGVEGALREMRYSLTATPETPSMPALSTMGTDADSDSSSTEEKIGDPV